MAVTPLSLLLLSLTTVLLFLSLDAQAQTPTAPAPAPSGPVNFTAILEKGGQYNTLIQLLNKTQTFNQIANQINSSSEGMTIFAPTDNAFSNLPSGALNKLSQQQQVQLLQYHMLPKFYTLSNLLLVSNPVSTQASGKDGTWGLNFAGQGNQVNVSTGLVEVQVNNALRQAMPLAVYEVDKVLLPEELFGVTPPTSSPPAPKTKDSSSKVNSTEASGPSPPKNSAGGRNVALGLVAGLGLICMGILS